MPAQEPPPRRVVLLASAKSYRNGPFVDAARRLGVEVVLGEDIPLPMIPKLRDGLPLDYRDLVRSTEAIVRFARERPVAAILGVDDSGTLLAARASAELGLRGNAPEATEAARNKHVMRRRFADAGVRSPRFRLLRAGDDPRSLSGSVRYPCVIKPTTLSASRGVMRADDPEEFVCRFERLVRILAAERCDEVLVEDYVPGVELALEGLLDRGSLRVLALFDKPDPLEGPFFEETIYVTPSRLAPATQDAVREATLGAAAALGLREGPIHAELRVNEKGPWLVEVAARSIGGLCSKTLRFGAGSAVSLEELILRQALGLDLGDAPREDRAGGVLMLPIPRAGILRAVHGIREAQAVPLVESVEITARLNNPLLPLPEGDSYLGFVFARGDSPAAVEAALREAQACLRFEIVTDLPLQRTTG
jgi:biotin carboxylase